MEWYDDMEVAQGEVCAICKQPSSKQGVLRFDVDHNHATKKVRGLLCRHCNLMLGHARDDPKRLYRAIYYLRKHST